MDHEELLKYGYSRGWVEMEDFERLYDELHGIQPTYLAAITSGTRYDHAVGFGEWITSPH